VDVVGWITRWVNDPDNAKQLAQYVGTLLPRILKSLARPELGEFLGNVARQGVESVPAAPLASKLLAVLWAGGPAQGAAGARRALDLGERSLRRNKPAIHRIVSEHSSRWIPKWVDNMIAERVMAGLLSTLQELRDPDHPWRVELSQAMGKLIADLATDPDMHAVGERMKAQLLANPLFPEQARSLWDEIDPRRESDPQAHAETTARTVEVALHNFGRWLEQDPDRQRRFNRWIRLLMLRILLPRRAEIGAYVTQVVQNWDAATLVDR